MDDGNSVTTKLLTLLNVSATKIGKRKRVDEFVHSETKLNRRKSATTADPSPPTPEERETPKSTEKSESTLPKKLDSTNESETAEVEEGDGRLLRFM